MDIASTLSTMGAVDELLESRRPASTQRERHQQRPRPLGRMERTCAALALSAFGVLGCREAQPASNASAPTPAVSAELPAAASSVAPPTAANAPEPSAIDVPRQSCTSSQECPRSTLCCGAEADGEVDACQPAAADAEFGCLSWEVCRSDADCRSPNTRCRNGSCKRRGVNLRCGGATCGDSAPVCCIDPGKAPVCVADVEGACAVESLHADCASDRDCAIGQHCCNVRSMFTFCAAACTNSGLGCATVKDCPEQFGRKPVSCSVDFTDTLWPLPNGSYASPEERWRGNDPNSWGVLRTCDYGD